MKKKPRLNKKTAKTNMSINNNNKSVTTKKKQQKRRNFARQLNTKTGKFEHESGASSQKQLLIVHESHQKWFEYQLDEVRTADQGKPSEALLHQTEARAEQLLKRDIELFTYLCRTRNRGDANWLEMVAKQGTFTDRLSALQLRVQRSPMHALPHLSEFVSIVQRKSEKIRQAHSITKALKELFLAEFLPPQRKLMQFSQRPLEKWANSTGREAEKRLVMWKFESDLKQYYRQFVESLQTLAGNTVEGVAIAACRELAQLLAERPEQEHLLLSALVNKLGHPLHRVGAGVAECLEREVTQRHPNMRPVVVLELETLIFRRNISPKAQRYALHFLSRMLLDAGESELALQLIRIYLRLFRILVAKEAMAEHAKLLPLLVTGLNRAFPYAKGRTSEVLNDVESLYSIVQTAKFSTALSVLRLLFQIHSTSDGLSDRFYSTFYRRLLNLQPGTQHDMQLFTLAQQILKHDFVENRVRAFLKRFFQIALSANSAFAAATLLMCHTVVRERPQLLRLEGIREKGEIDRKQQRQHKNNLAASTSKQSKTEIKEEQQANNEHKLTKNKVVWLENVYDMEEDEEEEHYVDVKDEDGGESMEEKKVHSLKAHKSVRHGWLHNRSIGASGAYVGSDNDVRKRQSGKVEADVRNNRQFAARHCYDPNARNPLFAGTEWSLDTELIALSRHFHPTVASFAQALIKAQPILYRGNPLVDLSQMRFLDRFAFKNPKTKHTEQKNVADKRATGPLFGNSYVPSGVKALNPTSQDYLSKQPSEIPLDERFLHHYATVNCNKWVTNNKIKKKHQANDDDEADEDDVASLNSDEFDLLMERFEPGESREVFDVDFGAEFGDEADSRSKRKALKRKRKIDGSDDDDANEEGDALAASDSDDDELDGNEDDDEEEDDGDGEDDDDDVPDYEESNEDDEFDDEEVEEELEFD